MPQRTHSKSLFHMLFLAAALSLLSAVVRRERRQQLKTARDRRKTTRVAPKRIAPSVGFATLFFAGAAFSAGAGNTVVSLIDPSTESAADTTTTDTTVADAAPAPAPAPASSPTPSSEVVPASEPAAEPAAPEAPEVDRPDAPKAVSQSVADNPSGGTVDSASRIRASFARSRVEEARFEPGLQRRRQDRRPDRARPAAAGPARDQDPAAAAAQAGRPRAGGRRAERGRNGLALPRPARPHAAVPPPEAGLRAAAEADLAPESRRLGTDPRRPACRRRARRRSRLQDAARST